MHFIFSFLVKIVMLTNFQLHRVKKFQSASNWLSFTICQSNIIIRNYELQFWLSFMSNCDGLYGIESCKTLRHIDVSWISTKILDLYFTRLFLSVDCCRVEPLLHFSLRIQYLGFCDILVLWLWWITALGNALIPFSMVWPEFAIHSHADVISSIKAGNGVN